MKKEQTEHKITLIISIVLLVVLLIFLLVYLVKGNNKLQSTSLITTCALDSSEDIFEVNSEIKITSEKGKVTRLDINTERIYTENELLMSYNYEEEKEKIDNFQNIEGINLNVVSDSKLGTITISGDIDYKTLVIPNKLVIEPPYENYIKNPLTTNEIINYLTKEGYKCE